MENDKDVYSAFKLLYSERTTGSRKIVGATEKCDSCGMGIGNFVKTMRVGCVDCYDAFSFVIEMIDIDDSDSSHESYELLAMQLSKAVEEERYEDAADIRDLMEETSG
jgi:protein-arginine kinase activator protein McsA